MKLLIIIFLLPVAIFAHRYRVTTDPNDAPFLPIFPVYPYNPKLMKRGVEKDHLFGQISSDLYAPKPDAKDSYTTKYNGNYHRDSHSSISPTQSVYQASYISPNQAYAQSTAYTPGSTIPSQYYNTNPYLYTIYNGYPVALVTQSHSVNPRLPNNYYYQQQYHPNYHQAYSTGIESSQIGHEHDEKIFGKYQDNLKNELNIKDSQFIDGTNYLTNSKELDTSASTYRLPNHNNQDNDISDVHLRSAQLPRTMIRIVPYDDQQFRAANYAVASGYKYPQLSQQLINQAVGNGFGQPTVGNVAQGQYDIAQVNGNLPGKNNLQLSSAPVIAKTGLAYVMNSGSFNISPRHIPNKALDSYQNLDSSVIPMRNHKPITTVSVEGSHGLYIPPIKLYKHQSQLPDYNSYTSQNGQVYNGLSSSMLVDYKKNEQNYSTENIQQIQPDQSYSYQYSGYQPTSNNQQQLDNYKITLDDVNYASKRNS